jgi:site-specific DNA-methyltransferase (adenine-specific)
MMELSDKFFLALGIKPDDYSGIKKLSVDSGIPATRLKYYNEVNIIPSGKDLRCILEAVGISEIELMLRMGSFNRQLTEAIERHYSDIYRIIKGDLGERHTPEIKEPRISLETPLGRLYQGNCLDLMPSMDDDSVDLIFADPPFNLNKLYGSGINDNLKKEQYLAWCEEWIGECIRILKFGGSFLLWNLPKWNTSLAEYLNSRLTFRHWIASDIKYRLPISGRLYPSHYSLLYYSKGIKPKTFHPDRLPMPVCPSCKFDLTDYGGYKDKMNAKGVNLTDVWFDIPPVRHAKYKKRKGANELSIKLLDRIIEMASDEGDLVFDPFGGAGTTYVVSEIKKRRWVGIEIGPVDDIIKRFEAIREEEAYLNEIRKNLNCLFTEDTLKERMEKGLWTCETVRKYKRTPEAPKLFQFTKATKVYD